MKNKRTIYLIVSFATIGAGLLARLNKHWFPDVVNLYLGDILYAFMMFYIVSFLIPGKSFSVRSITALAICYAIETFQLYQADWINAVRLTIPGKLILGSGFLWSDLLAYLIGITAAFLVDKFALFRTKIRTGNIT